MAFTYHALKLGQVRFVQVAIRRLHVDGMPLRLRTTVYGVMFGARHRQHVAWIVPLHAPDESNADFAGEVRVFAISLLPTSPAWIPQNIDVGCPEVQPGPPLCIAVVLIGIIIELGAAFDANNVSFLAKQLWVPRRGRARGLREYRRHAIVGHAVECLSPVVIGGQPQPSDAGCGILDLPHLLRQRHAANQVVDAGAEGLIEVAPDRRFLHFGHALSGRGKCVCQFRCAADETTASPLFVLDVDRVELFAPL